MACEGLMASRFGRRPSSAGQKALEQLRAERDAGARAPSAPVIAFPGNEDPRIEPGGFRARERAYRIRPSRWLAMAAAVLGILTAGFLLLRWGTEPDVCLWAEGPGLMIERDGQRLAIANRIVLKPDDIIQTPPGSQARIVFRGNTNSLILAGNSRLSWAGHKQSLKASLWAGQIELIDASMEWPVACEIRTPHGTVKSEGAKFLLIARPSSTWVHVLEGKVLMSQSDERTAMEVSSGFYSVAAPGIKPTAQQEGERWQSPYYASVPGGGTS